MMENANNIEPRLTDEIRQFAIELFALGYTVRTIAQKVKSSLGQQLTERQLMQLAIAYAPEVELARREVSKMALQGGLADKGVRVARLTLLAEQWEAKAETSEKAANLYLKVLQQVQNEVEPLGLRMINPESDPWGRLLLELKDKATRQELPPSPNEDASAEH